MRVVVQRVSNCSVEVEGRITGTIGPGLLVYFAVSREDNRSNADYLVKKITGLRIFEDSNGKMNLSVADIKAEICVVSQFTLYGDMRKGNRPSFSRAAKPELAIPLYEYFTESLRNLGFTVATGEFGAHMNVAYVNDGPVTILIDSEAKR